MSKNRVAIVLGSTRPGRFSEHVGHWLASRLELRADFDVEVVDLRDYPLPMFSEEKSPARTGREYSTPEIAAWGRKIDEQDAYVFVTPEYNHGYSAVLKNAIDHIFVEWNHKPVSFVSYGNVGGARAVEQLRLVAVELEMAPLRQAIHVLPGVLVARRQNPEISNDELFKTLEAKADLLADELTWWSRALAEGRSS